MKSLRQRMLAGVATCALFCAGGCVARALGTGEAAPAPKPNRLAKSRSPYLRGAAHSPIDWREWGAEAFAEAKRDNKPVLLDIGAVWCHWCHVMDEKTYERPEIAKLLNEKFICIKVDRDERPDVDRRYQEACGVLGAAGWPLTAFLTPTGKVFAAGTYFPPEDTEARIGFKTVLERVVRAWSSTSDKVLETADRIHETLSQNQPADRAVFSPAVIDKFWHEIASAYDERFGGFGKAESVSDSGVPRGAKFATGSALELALARHFEKQEAATLQLVKRTLNFMADGGLHDQIGGGFHRYSVDGAWRIPHFEKMLYGQAELLRCYAIGFQASGADRYRAVSERLIGYVNRELRDPDGNGFYASQDADNARDDDGSYYTWTLEEMAAALSPDEHNVCLRFFGLDDRRNRMEGSERFVLQRALSGEMLAQKLSLSEDRVVRLVESGSRKLLEARGQRKQPIVDKTFYINWNAAMISALIQGYRAFGNREWRDQALALTDRLMTMAYRKKQGMLHQIVDGEAAGGGLLDDQAQMARALLDAFEVSGHQKHLDSARELLELVQARFSDPAGGFCDRVHGDNDLGFLNLKVRPVDDAPTPGANSVAALALVRLALATGEQKYEDWAGQTLRALTPHALQFGRHGSTFALATREFFSPGPLVLVIGKRDDARTQILWATAQRTWRPGAFVMLRDPATKDLRYPPSRDGSPLAYVCSNGACAPPTAQPEALAQTIKTFGLRRPK